MSVTAAKLTSPPAAPPLEGPHTRIAARQFPARRKMAVSASAPAAAGWASRPVRQARRTQRAPPTRSSSAPGHANLDDPEGHTNASATDRRGRFTIPPGTSDAPASRSRMAAHPWARGPGPRGGARRQTPVMLTLRGRVAGGTGCPILDEYNARCGRCVRQPTGGRSGKPRLTSLEYDGEERVAQASRSAARRSCRHG